jgi:hypothetical protein
MSCELIAVELVQIPMVLLRHWAKCDKNLEYCGGALWKNFKTDLSDIFPSILPNTIITNIFAYIHEIVQRTRYNVRKIYYAFVAK